MSRWQRLAASIPILITLIEKATSLRTLTGTAQQDAIVELADGVSSVIELVVGRDLINEERLREGVRAALNVRA